MSELTLPDATQALRRFWRFFTHRIGVLGAHHLDSRFTLAQARLIYELGVRDATTAGALCTELGLDPGYVSRMVKGFVAAGLVETRRSPEDGRERRLALTAAGRDHAMAFPHEAPRDGCTEPGRCAGHEYDHGSVSKPEKMRKTEFT